MVHWWLRVLWRAANDLARNGGLRGLLHQPLRVREGENGVTDRMEEAFWQSLERQGNQIALISDGEEISYGDLAQRADAWAASLGARLPAGVARPLVCLEFPRRVAAIVAYLGCLRAGWPVILLAEGEAQAKSQILQDFNPNVVLRWTGAGQAVDITEAGPAEFCDGLAVLLSTSGTTGASKLVKLSQDNIEANARSIVEYLGITPAETAITTLPLHYSFGMSVLHSHLRAGACVAVCDEALTEPAFWDRARAAGVTSLALVPTQYELLERIGFSEDWLPGLRSMTQAGGRLDPILAEGFARRAAAKGWRLFFMYGQTEASPRIAYLPPEDAVAHFDKIGRAVPGGRLTLEDGDGHAIEVADVPGELVYSGPNVMIGYALQRADLARPKDTFALRTGDIAVRTQSGHFRIVGRTSRFLKLNGLRIGLDEVENVIRRTGRRALASGDDRGLVVFVTEPGGEAALCDCLADRFHLMRSAVAVQHLSEPPLLASGKVDYRSLRGMAEAVLSEGAATGPREDLMQVLARILHQPMIDPQRSFRELGGDSLAFLEIELHLTKVFGEAPEGWEQMPLRTLVERGRAATAGAKPRIASLQRIGTDVPIRVLAIFWVVLLHTTSIGHGGGVYALTILSGHSFARHQMTPLLAGHVGRTVTKMLRPLVISYLGLLAILSLHFEVDWQWFAFVANFWVAEDVPPSPDLFIPYWYVSAYVQAILVAALPFLLASVRARVARDPFLPGLVVTAVLTAFATFWPLVPYPAGLIRLPDGFLALFGLGWCIAVARTHQQRLMVTAFAAGVWFVCWRGIDVTVDLGILSTAMLLLWLPKARVPGLLARALREIGALTMFIYLMHVPALYFDTHFFTAEPVVFGMTVVLSVGGAVVARWLYQRAERAVLAIRDRTFGASAVGTNGAPSEEGLGP